jgi:hypothetical protein
MELSFVPGLAGSRLLSRWRVTRGIVAEQIGMQKSIVFCSVCYLSVLLSGVQSILSYISHLTAG